MKQSYLALPIVMLLTSCAGVHVTKTYIATGATEPAAIYVRPFDISEAEVKGHHSNTAEPIGCPLNKSSQINRHAAENDTRSRARSKRFRMALAYSVRGVSEGLRSRFRL